MLPICTQKIKKKIRISLIIRISVLLCVALISSVSVIYSLENGESFTRSPHSDVVVINQNRKLLSVISSPYDLNPIEMPHRGLIVNFAEKMYNLINSSYHSHFDKPIQNECTKPTILEFPSDGFTREQRQMGWIILHFVLVCYCFWLLATVCDEYFVPAIEIVCKRFGMQEDVAGATLMAAATSSPELFINCVGTFVTKGDLGVGTVVGSAVFNILAVPACCGLLAGHIIDLDWWPISRDCLMYGISILLLIVTIYDGKIVWYESLILLIAYALYITFMCHNQKISRSVKSFVDGFKPLKSTSRCYTEVTEITPLVIRNDDISRSKFEANNNINSEIISIPNHNNKTHAKSPWTKDESNKYIYFMRWPITLLLWSTIPDCRKNPKLRFFAFVMCICWIGVMSYIVAFLITIIGDTVNIPDSVMGLTFLAAGTSIPEALSSIIVTNQGHGNMGISNSIGSNIFDILFCLALPWFIKAVFIPASPGDPWVLINSAGLPYTVISLLTTLLGLYIAFIFNKFRLDWKIGLTCTLMYIVFVVVSSLVELNIFFPVNLPTCSH